MTSTTFENEVENLLSLRAKVAKEQNGELYLMIDNSELLNAVCTLSKENYELVNLFCVDQFAGQDGLSLFYVFEKIGYREILFLQTLLRGNIALSIAKAFSSACWYEREVTDGFGVKFEGAFDERRLFLHETYSKDFHPLLKSFLNAPGRPHTSVEDDYVFKSVDGEGVYQIPVGPVHAGIIEPGHFRFSVIGETIFNLEVRMFYKHRGLEKLTEGKSPKDVVKIAEAVSGDETVANAVAYCSAVEKICSVSIPVRALQLRTIFLELERIYSYLGDLAGMIIDVAYPAGASPFFVLREEIFRINEQLTGSRFLKGVVTLGGITKDAPEAALANLSVFLRSFPMRLQSAESLENTYFSLIDRFETTGKVKAEIVTPLHLTGPIARASGKMTDTRIDHPYGLYGELDIKGRTLQNGDVLARFELKAAEALDSVKIIMDVLSNLQDGPICSDNSVVDGYAFSMVESARGQSVFWVCIRKGLVERVKVRTASFCNWQAIEHAVLGNIVPDFPLINKSMNLSYAGTDL